MFAKSFKLKSTNTLKNTEKKQLVQRLVKEFPGASEDELKQLLPNKATANCLRVTLHSGELISVYVVEGVPLLLERGTTLVPTVCALWRIPKLLPTVVIHTAVLAKVQGGAGVYVPGVAWAMGDWVAGGLLAAVSEDCGSAALVGTAVLSPQQLDSATSGVCIEPLQWAGDELMRSPRLSAPPRPPQPPPAPPTNHDIVHRLQQLSVVPPPLKQDWPALGARPTARDPSAALSNPSATPVTHAWARPTNAPAVIPEPSPVVTPVEPTDTPAPLGDDAGVDQYGVPLSMDGLLRHCLLCVVRRPPPLPVKVNLFYKNHLMPWAPPERPLDVKKSSFKKMNKFLEAMEKEGLISLREEEKGVWSVVGMRAEHPAARAHSVSPLLKLALQQHNEQQRMLSGAPPPPQEAPLIREMYCITAAVLPLFTEHKKGAALTPPEVRVELTKYVRARNLAAGKGVTLDASLATAIKATIGEVVSWEAVMRGVTGRMTQARELSGVGGAGAGGANRLTKQQLDPVRMNVVTRSGNKKVTLVSNLEQYGLSPGVVARVAQRGVGAACGVTRTAGDKHDVLMLQGDQTYFVVKLLLEEYKLPKKFIEGADKVLSKKK